MGRPIKGADQYLDEARTRVRCPQRGMALGDTEPTFDAAVCGVLAAWLVIKDQELVRLEAKLAQLRQELGSRYTEE